MRFRPLAISIFSIACSLFIHAGIARAAIETWVSGNGTDAGNCSINAPCATFQFAHDQTNGNGAINVLSSGKFGPVIITKPISIVADGVEALINTGSGGAGILVQAGGGAVISLRGLTIDLRGTNNTGIAFVSGAALHVHDSVIRKSTDGINFSPSAGTPELYVANSEIADVSGSGVVVSPTGSAGAKAVLDRVRVENASSDGIAFLSAVTTGSVSGMVRDSLTAGNGGAGIRASESTGGTTAVMVERTVANNNSSGITSANAAATIRIGDSTVSGNIIGLHPLVGGVIESYETNKIDANGVNGVATNIIAMK